MGEATRLPFRYTPYPVTPTASVEAFQASDTVVAVVAVEWRLPGTEGAVVSPAGAPIGSSMSSWISSPVSARSYTRISSIEPSNHSFQIVLPPIRSVPLEAVITPVVAKVSAREPFT